MRELNTQEIAAVSGASLASIGSFLGFQAGNLADFITSKIGLSTNFGSYTSQIGTGIGQLFSLNFTDAKANITNGYNGLVSAIITAVGSFFKE
ncbi:hypothetical protein Y71_00425 [Kosakonia radicincitans DSM 16656]|uniref:Toxin CdiA n=1 Tax=Kosakonia radicincitans TaxID=283686 RepID=A0AAX2EXR2_9ENTR|nr:MULTISPECIES: hypothetical protein [Kosakonia]MDP9568440.1 hypothetical protein [Kosakonia oryzae]APG20526.1 hypothetical protein A3780_24250 [Kosakonia radicincitans]ARD58446.1 hypothetical protein Y71_00425 [Kosakonia radicincitans DSM 16656]KDE36750.1 hypothetical protein AW40_10015 [Kosakonia radicincitans UMEnt01/12]NCF06412.1 hypothetical protein [Kosakonia sp. MH5]